MGIFDKRVNFKPFEYPETMDFVDNLLPMYRIFIQISLPQRKKW